MTGINFENLLSTGAHFGHVTRKWHPRFKPYILMEKNGIHIINLEETVKQFEKAADYVKKVVDKGGEVLFVGTKKQAREIVQQEADRCGMFYVVERWLGGTLTNFMTIKKSIKRLHVLEKEGSSIYENLTKKEVQMLNRERIKLADQHRGIKDMRRLPDALVVVDTSFESTAVAEARSLEIPVIGLLDTNTDPTKVDFPIPANDDSIRTIQLLVSNLADAVIDARKSKAAKIEEAAAAKEEAKAKEAAARAKAKAEAEEQAKEKAASEPVAEEKAKIDTVESEKKETASKPVKEATKATTKKAAEKPKAAKKETVEADEKPAKKTAKAAPKKTKKEVADKEDTPEADKK